VMKLLGPVAWWSPRSVRQVQRPVSVPVIPKAPLIPEAALADRSATK